MQTRSASKERLLKAGLELVSRDAVTGVAKLLSPEALQAEARRGTTDQKGVSRHTAYRLWGTNRGQAIVDLADYVAKTTLESAAELFSSLMEAHAKAVRDLELHGQAVVDFDPESETTRAGMRRVIRLIFEWQLESAGVPAGWALQTAALTSSPLWRGPRPDADVEATGRRVLDARSAQYSAGAERWVDVLESLLALWGRRPRDRTVVATLVRLMGTLIDGSLLRIFIDPEVNDPNVPDERRQELLDLTISLVSDTILDLVWTYTDPALVDDPRRPDPDERHEDVVAFDRLVDTAVDLYAKATEAVSPVDAAENAGVTPTVAAALFPTDGDLADSVLRRLIVPSGLDFSMSRVTNPTPLIELVLRRLRQAASTHPTAIEVIQQQAPLHPGGAVSLLSQMNRAIAAALRSPTVNCPDPQDAAYTLIELTLAGDSGWKAVEAILTVYGSSRTD